MSTDLAARRLALAALRLHEAGDHAAVTELVRGLDADELRAVLIAQTANSSLVLHAAFGGPLLESQLPSEAAASGRSRAETVADYLGNLIVRLAAEEAEQQ